MTLTRQEIFDNIHLVKEELVETRKCIFNRPLLIDNIGNKIISHLQDLEDELSELYEKLAENNQKELQLNEG